MELGALIEKQITSDRRHGFAVDFADDGERLAQLEKDLVGMVGEVGEFANLLKKVRLAESNQGYEGPSLRIATEHLRDEIADVAIYLMRLSFILGGALEADILMKMAVNDQRYENL